MLTGTPPRSPRQLLNRAVGPGRATFLSECLSTHAWWKTYKPGLPSARSDASVMLGAGSFGSPGDSALEPPLCVTTGAATDTSIQNACGFEAHLRLPQQSFSRHFARVANGSGILAEVRRV
ncbi:hypothetical protein Bbelb_139590 [Branchiostoma belcheri]|nr:hypothetical protein Bbelb_139590 [Branchiostoma belcheri]